ncbi:transcriptional regulator [Scopulibacillus darangshiensis]|uniref:Transcriptional regulator n=1 Tax=Scopulibacillus darangshiensis TaxID=442528 RepID=A0A4R2P7V9_9BACL|nr:ROK family protein [Scopulibacillus darangshiensis]TCP30993.1 transcriptional regulator [Scopulibacillus darangshiensis]
MNYMAFDIGGTNVKYGVVDNSGNIVKKGSFPTPKAGIDVLVVSIAAITKKLQQLYNIDGIALSAPGAVNNETGFIEGTSALPYLHGPNIREHIEKTTRFNVIMENDANCAALAEVWNGVAKHAKDVLFIVCGTGIGGAVIKDRVLHTGSHLHGGEFGYMLVEQDYQTKRFVRWSKKGSTKSLVSKVVSLKKSKEENWNGEKVFQYAENGDADCQVAIDEFFETMATGIYNLQYMYDPDMIVIGGAISFRDDIVSRIYEKLDILIENVDVSPVYPNVQKCKYSNDANLLGAVYNYLTIKEFLL